jgi:hypothetical protein
MRPVFCGRLHAEPRMGRLAIVVVEPAPELREHGFGIAELGAEDIVTLEGMHEGPGEPIALRVIGWVVIGTRPRACA